MNKNYKFIFLDILVATVALYLSFSIRFEFIIPNEFFLVFVDWLPWFIVVQLVVFYFSGLYNRIWRYTSLFDLYAILTACLLSVSISVVITVVSMQYNLYPRSVLLLYFILNTIFIISSRLSVRVYYSHYYSDDLNAINNQRKRLILIGAGKTGEKIAKDIRTTARSQYYVTGFLDDNIDKHGALLHGRKVFGNIASINKLNLSYDEILITAPSASGDQMRKIVNFCKETGKRYRTVPGINELIDGEITLDKVRDVSYADLLGREEVTLDMNSIDNTLNGKRILITGAGGSIGSELVRQCLFFEPSEIICLDINEEKIYSIDQNYSSTNKSTIIKTVLASVNRKNELEKVFIENRPQIVFHAAAYKHVPIQETHPWTAVNTNMGGTLNLLLLSDQYLVDQFVLVSTDKAVNPVNVMGATKRASEKLIQSFNLKSKTTMMAVRFGNVLGSSGSAIPTFQRQINSGGPITITHPEMQRYFMSIPEASQLILQCSAIGRNGEIFLLDMGKPIKIVQMAKDLIRLSGLEPEKDIPIVYTGLRPGEKLYEELQMLNEQKIYTNHKKIMILKQKELPMKWEVILEATKALLAAAESLDSEKILLILKQLLPTYSNFSINSEEPINYQIKGEA